MVIGRHVRQRCQRTELLRWLSWVNHLDNDMPASLLAGLAELLELTPEARRARLIPPRWERSFAAVAIAAATGSCNWWWVHSSMPHLSYQRAEHARRPRIASGNISNWHVDGEKEERIVAAAICYLDIDCLEGAAQFQHRDEMWLDDQSAGRRSRAIVAHARGVRQLRPATSRPHRPRRWAPALRGVPPDSHAPTTPRQCTPAAAPRSASARVRAHSHALVGGQTCGRGIMLPPELIEHICELAADLDGPLHRRRPPPPRAGAHQPRGLSSGALGYPTQVTTTWKMSSLV